MVYGGLNRALTNSGSQTPTPTPREILPLVLWATVRIDPGHSSVEGSSWFGGDTSPSSPSIDLVT